MKRVLAVMVIVALAFSLTACGPVKISKDGVQIKGPDGSVVSLGEKVSLPDGYPKDVVPIISGGNINFANKTMDDKKQPTFGVMLTVEKPYADVLSYYKNAVKDAANPSVMEMGGEFHVLGGTKGAHDFAVTIAPTDVNNKKGSTVTITIQPKGTSSSSSASTPVIPDPSGLGSSSSGSSSGSSPGTSTNISGQGGSLPVGYPSDVVPVINGAVVDMGIKATEQNLSKYSVLLVSTKAIAEVRAYYIDALKGSTNYTEISFGDVQNLSGEKKSYAFIVTLSPVDPSDTKKGSHINIHLEQLSSASIGSGTSSSVVVNIPSGDGSVTLHAGYPSSTVPLITPHTLNNAVKEVEGGVDNHFVELETTKSLSDVLAYYDNLLKSAAGYNKDGDKEYGYSLSGTKGNYEFYIDIASINSSDPKKGSLVYISLYKK